jgi:hypothetical protein
VPFQPPPAVQAVASVEFQLSVVSAPLLTVVGLAVNVTVGRGADTVTAVDVGVLVPPAPVQTRV